MTLNSCSNFEKEEQSRRDHNTQYQTILKCIIIKHDLKNLKKLRMKPKRKKVVSSSSPAGTYSWFLLLGASTSPFILSITPELFKNNMKHI